MSTNERPLIGSVFERTKLGTSSALHTRLSRTPGTGFPVAQHRGKSAFARARDEANAKSNAATFRDNIPPVSQAEKDSPSLGRPAPMVNQIPIPTDTDALQRQIHEENERVIARMNRDEIEKEKKSVLEQLGEGAGDLLRRVQEARRRKELKEKEARARVGTWQGEEYIQTTDRDHVPLVAAPTPRRVSDGLATRPSILRVKSLEDIGRSVPSPLPVTSSTRPSSRLGRRLRFAEVTPEDVHVYESAPVSPKRTVLALPPPPDTRDESIVSLGTFRRNTIPFKRPRRADDSHTGGLAVFKKVDEPEEGTPEYIRRRYFPHIPANDPSLAWMDPPLPEMPDQSAPRFDLQGSPIPTSLSASLPSHLGLHHHAEGSRAGYTIDDIFLLVRSTVPAQRASMLGILAKIGHRLGQQVRHPDNPEKISEFVGQESQLRKRILAAGLSAIDQIGSLGAQAVEVVWQCLVGWDGMSEMEGVELLLAPDVVSSVQLDHLLPHITDVLSHAALPSESLAQLLDVVHWFAQQSNQIANIITATPRLVPVILNTFLLTPIPLKEGSAPPNHMALRLLITLASSSRSSASALLDPADSLLRFVTTLPPSSPYRPALATTLLTHTLWFYAVLSSYGLYCHIATTASEVFSALAPYVLRTPFPSGTMNSADSASRQLCIAWMSLIETWAVCATDPHATSPPHDILWSQICAWGWATDIRSLRTRLGRDWPDWVVYVAMWDAEAAWVEGTRINGVKGGEAERDEILQILRGTFGTGGGTEFEVVQRAVEVMQRDLLGDGQAAAQDRERILKSLATAGSVLASALRLWLACLPPLNNGAPLSTPPFALPFSDLSALSAMLAKHPIWFLPLAAGTAHLRTYLRPLTRFIIHFHRVSRYIPGTALQLWLAQALVFLPRLLPGDESHAFVILDAFSLVTPQFVGLGPAGIQGIHVHLLRPFFEYTILPEKAVYVAPLRPNTESISRSSTLRLPPLPSSDNRALSDGDGPDGHLAQTFAAGLPLSRDFMFTPLTHLLRSGTSPIFRAPPDDWTASEVDIVRATLLLAYAARKVLVAHGLGAFVHSAAEVAFACMRVCMLEDGVGTGGTEMEVFRDAVVERLMILVLEPFTAGGPATTSGGSQTATLSQTTSARTLEDAAAPYLGPTPFYQFYTDLVALYSAVSFAHSTFAALVVAPLAMHYAVDYRRALWCGGDHASSGSVAGSSAGSGGGSGDGGGGSGDVVRSLRVPVESVICTAGGDPREYLYPVERDLGLLGAYVAALHSRDGGGLAGFLRLVAVHHVACTVWGDLADAANVETNGDEDMPSEVDVKRQGEVRARLLRAVLVRGAPDVVRDVVLYRQHQAGAFLWPPACYSGGGRKEDVVIGDVDGSRWREERLAFMQRVFNEDDAIADQVKVLLCNYTTS